MIHRDLKPANIKVREDGTVKVLDFGLAKAYRLDEAEIRFDSPTATANFTRAGEVLGTVRYMSPEQARGERLDARTDIWSLGCVLYEALTGRAPFVGKTDSDTLAAILKDEPDWEALAGQPPPAVTMLVKRCLRKPRTKRLHHVGDVRIELEDAIDGRLEPQSAAEEDRSGRRPNRGPSVQQLTANPTEIAVSGAAISPDGTYLAYADPTGLYLRVIETGETSAVRVSDDLRFAELSWLPDGTRLIATGWSTLTDVVALYSISLLGGTPRKLRDGWRAAVSPDGSRVAFLSTDWPMRVIWIMGADGQNPRKLAVAEEGEMFWQVAWSPDGRRVAYGHSTADGAWTISSVGAEGGERTTLVSDVALFQHWRGNLPFAWLPDGRLLFGRRDEPPNQFTSRLWAVSTDPRSGVGVGTPGEIIGWAGFNVRDIRVTRDVSRLTVLIERNPPSIYVATLDETGSTLGSPKRLTLDDRYDYCPRWTHDGRTVLFQSNRGGVFDLFAQGLGSQVVDALVTSPRDKCDPEVSPDGRWLLYQHWVDPIVRLGLMRAPFADGRVCGPSEQVLPEEPFRFRCGANRCVLSEAQGSDLVFSELDPIGGRGPELMRHTMSFADPGFANWALSPDGSRVALTNFANQIQVLDLAAKSVKTLTIQDWTGLEYIDWAADGRSVFVPAHPVNGPRLNNTGLLRIDLDGQVNVLRHEANEWNVFPGASPNGRHLAFSTMVLDSNTWMVEDF